MQLLGCVTLFRGVAGYSHQTFPWRNCRSVGRSVGLSVRASVCPVHCGKTADRIRMPFGIIGRIGPRMRQVMWFGDRSTGRGTFGGEFGARHCNQWGLYGVGVRQCLNRRFGVVRAVSRGCITCGPRRARGRGFGRFLFPIFTMGNAIRSPTVKCFRFVCENLICFRWANVSLESSICGLFGDIFTVKINVGVYEKLAQK